MNLCSEPQIHLHDQKEKKKKEKKEMEYLETWTQLAT